jgi:hypothetical protein
MNRSTCLVSRQRGAAALIVTTLLVLAMLLGALFANRNLVFEQRISANQYRSTQAFEAAEAGLAWAEAQLNSNLRLGVDCNPAASGADSFRERYLSVGSSTGMLTPRSPAAQPATILRPTCVASADGWTCGCPTDGAASVEPPAGAAPAPAFSLQFLAGSKPGTVRVVATGCSSLAAPCRANGSRRADATAQVEVSLGLLGGLRVPPAAAVTAGGDVALEGMAFDVRNPDIATGIAVHAGGAIARVEPGASADVSVAGDTALAGLGPERFFTSYFGLYRTLWKEQAIIARLDCAANCATAIADAIDRRARSSILSIDGNLALAGPAVIGTAEHPVVLVVGGTARLSGAVAIHGVIYANAIIWTEASDRARIDGALISETSVRGSGAAQIVYDPQVLARLSRFAGSFARINGSWRDF